MNPCENLSTCLLSSTDPLGRVCKCADQLVEVPQIGQTDIVCKPKSEVPTLCNIRCNSGTCRFQDNKPKCYCPKEFEGEHCEHYRCSGYCKNKGICSVDDDVEVDEQDSRPPPLKCRCQSKWTGQRCEIDVHVCKDFCHNGATCSVNERKEESCICAVGYEGEHCQNCNDLACEHNGICKKRANGESYCECPIEFQGRKCELSICEGYCNGNGVCQSLLGSAKCTCNPGKFFFVIILLEDYLNFFYLCRLLG